MRGPGGGGGALRAPARRQALGLPAGRFSRVRAGGPHPGKLPPPPRAPQTATKRPLVPEEGTGAQGRIDFCRRLRLYRL